MTAPGVLPEVKALADRVLNRSCTREEWSSLLEEFGQLFSRMRLADLEYLTACGAGKPLLDARYGNQPETQDVSLTPMLLVDLILASESVEQMRELDRELQRLQDQFTWEERQYVAHSGAGEMLYHVLSGSCPGNAD